MFSQRGDLSLVKKPRPTSVVRGVSPEKGMDSSSIMKCLSVNRPTSVTKVYGSVAWRNIEIAHISKALNLTMEEIFEIFIKPCVQDWTPVDLISPKSDGNPENL